VILKSSESLQAVLQPVEHDGSPRSRGKIGRRRRSEVSGPSGCLCCEWSVAVLHR